MLQVTKIFRFEAAHAIHGYAGKCRNIHGHSYKLYITVASKIPVDEYIPATGILFDFKDLKHLVNEAVIEKLDHRLLLSEAYLAEHPALRELENVTACEMEPTAENLLLFIRKNLQEALPQGIELCELKIYETADSYATWDSE